jgi:hypothetical protein
MHKFLSPDADDGMVPKKTACSYTSKYQGVSKYKRAGGWQVQLKFSQDRGDHAN